MIYFLREKLKGNIKIGYSIYPDQRKQNLQTGNSEELEFLCIMEGDFEEENFLHKKFEEFKIRGEWYSPSDKLLNYIDGIVKLTKHRVSFVGNNHYRITFSHAVEFTKQWFYLLGTHDIRALCDEDLVFIFAIEGERCVLIDWLQGLDGISPDALEEFLFYLNRSIDQ